MKVPVCQAKLIDFKSYFECGWNNFVCKIIILFNNIGAGNFIRDKFVDADLHDGNPAYRSRILHHPTVLRGDFKAVEAARISFPVTHLLPLRRKYYWGVHHPSVWSH